MKQYLICLAYMCCLQVCGQPLSEGRRLFFDSWTDTYLCSIDESNFVNQKLYEKTLEGKYINFTFLPIVQIKGDFGEEYSQGTVTVSMADGSGDSCMLAKIKWRGGITAGENKHKKSYHIKFIDSTGEKQDRKFFGFRSDNSWLLDACQIDMSRVRNRVAMELWNDFAAKPYYYSEEPKLRNYTRGQFVELFLGDEYRGIYCMSEAIDRSQLKLKKTSTDGTIHGGLWKGNGFKYTRFSEYADYDNSSETWGDWEVKYPDVEDGTDWSILYNAVRYVTDASESDFFAHVGEYIDMPVYKDFYLFEQVLHAVDNMSGKNKYWACYDKQTDKKITLFPWDLDCTVGQYFNNINHFQEDDIRPEIYFDEKTNEKLANLYSIYYDNEGMLHPSDWSYLDELNSRYVEYRKNIFREDSLISRYDHYMDMLTKCGAYKRDSLRWSGDSDIDGMTLDFVKERAYIHDWIHRRLLSLDQQFADPLKAFHEYITIIDEPKFEKQTSTIQIYNVRGMRVSGCLSDLPAGIYIINGKKVLVK